MMTLDDTTRHLLLHGLTALDVRLTALPTRGQLLIGLPDTMDPADQEALAEWLDAYGSDLWPLVLAGQRTLAEGRRVGRG